MVRCLFNDDLTSFLFILEMADLGQQVENGPQGRIALDAGRDDLLRRRLVAEPDPAFVTGFEAPGDFAQR